VKKDHYSVLGVTPASEDVVIRAAYRALMRRYHPDADSSAEAAERAREINEAYRVLSEPGSRARYDDGLKQQSPLKFDPEFRPGPPEPKRLRIAPLAAIGFAAVAAGMVAFAVSPSVREFVELPSSEVEEEAPKTQASILPAKSTTKAPTDHCADPSAADLVKAELFRRAADLRPVERARLERVAQLAQLRIDASKAAANGCSGWLAVDFPPGLVVDGSRSNLNADIGFRLAQSEQGLRLASLSRVDGVVRSIVTLGPPPREPEAIRPPDTKEIAAVEPSKRPSRKSTALPAATTSNAARTPSPDQSRSACASAASRSERIICASDNLSSLDRQLALLYRQSWKEADEKKRAALIGTRQRFNDRREACGSSNCMTTAYVTRLREISEIMAGKIQQ
jgi:uncharacterized protein YecT (DUF1311 family)